MRCKIAVRYFINVNYSAMVYIMRDHLTILPYLFPRPEITLSTCPYSISFSGQNFCHCICISIFTTQTNARAMLKIMLAPITYVQYQQLKVRIYHLKLNK